MPGGEAAQRAAVAAEALAWLRTPYHHHARVRGVGVDCVQILCAVYEAAGVVPHVEPGDYAHDWHLHHSDELYLQGLLRLGAVEFDPAVQTPALGDVALFRFGRCWAHGAILATPEGQLVHAYLGRGVVLSRLDEEPLAGRQVRWFTVWGGAA